MLSSKETDTSYIKYHYTTGLWIEEHLDASNHSTTLFTVHYKPSRYTVDPGAVGGGDEVTYYPITDVQGTVYGLMNSTGSIVASYSYSPFGERLTNAVLQFISLWNKANSTLYQSICYLLFIPD